MGLYQAFNKQGILILQASLGKYRTHLAQRLFELIFRGPPVVSIATCTSNHPTSPACPPHFAPHSYPVLLHTLAPSSADEITQCCQDFLGGGLSYRP